LTVLVDSNAKRCPSCHSRLRKRRNQPIVLGEWGRRDMQATLAVDRWDKSRREGTFGASDATPVAPSTIERTEPEPEVFAIVVETDEPEIAAVVETPVTPEIVAEPEVFLEEQAEPEVDDGAERVVVADAIAAFTLPEPTLPEPERAPEPEPVIDLTEPAPEPLAAVAAAASPWYVEVERAERTAEARTESTPASDDVLEGDLNSVVDALHRKARGEAVEGIEPLPAPRPQPVKSTPRPLRLTSGSRRRRRR
jgi:hypothetical protein